MVKTETESKRAHSYVVLYLLKLPAILRNGFRFRLLDCRFLLPLMVTSNFDDNIQVIISPFYKDCGNFYGK